MRNSFRLNLLIASLLSASTYAADLTTDKIEVISQTPLPSLGISLDQYSSSVQNVKATDIKKSQSLGLGDFMNENLIGVHINETQNNPLQPDVNYRGFTASPLLGTPQGLSVYMDGVRMNESFGDIVSWDLIPKNAISSMQLHSGSNPLFGLNTLGGALSINTKDGRSNPGGALQFTTGSWGRKIGEFEYGGISKDNSIDYFFAGTWFDEDGWRDHSPSENKQFFGKLGWRNDNTTLKLSYSFADSDLNGNGLSPMSQLKSNYNSVYTNPDNTKNNSHLLNLNWEHYFNKDTVFSGNAYYRNIKSRTINGDVNGNAFADTVTPGAGYMLGETNMVRSGSTAISQYDAALNQNICLVQNQSSGGEAPEKCNGLINRTKTNQETFGVFAQVARNNLVFNKPNTYVLGGGYEYARSHFQKTGEYGTLLDGGGVSGSGYFATEYRGTVQNANHYAYELDANVKSTTKTWSAFGTDTISLLDNLHLTASGRFNHQNVVSRDQNVHHEFISSGDRRDSYSDDVDEAASLSGNHTFHRFNPSVGLTFKPIQSLVAFGNYNEGSRAPTAMELDCANPNAPCRTPSAMAGDPDLKQVVSRTFEGGFRGTTPQNIVWGISAYNTRLTNDIIFVSATSLSGQNGGYFTNFGETQRRGLDLNAATRFDKFTIAANYSYLEATYEADGTFVSNFSSSTTSSGTTTEGNSYKTIDVKKGNQIAGMPNNILKLFADYSVNEKLTLSANTLSVGSVFVKGAENNTGIGSSLPGYTLLNISATYSWLPELTIFGKMNNVFDKEYYTAGALGANVFDSNHTPSISSSRSGSAGTCGDYGYGGAGSCQYTKGMSIAEAFAAPGAPRAAWIGVRYEFGGKKSSSTDKD
jgi:outer membrane receptor protein involved in Fe transport